jgi:hypothetical protein
MFRDVRLKPDLRKTGSAAFQLPRTGGSVMKPTLAIPARWHA